MIINTTTKPVMFMLILIWILILSGKVRGLERVVGDRRAAALLVEGLCYVYVIIISILLLLIIVIIMINEWYAVRILSIMYDINNMYVHIYIYRERERKENVYTYIHTYIHTYMHACMHAYIHTYIHTYIYIIWQWLWYVYRGGPMSRSSGPRAWSDPPAGIIIACIMVRSYRRHTYIYIYIYIHTHMFMCICTHMFVYIYIYIYTYIYIYICNCCVCCCRLCVCSVLFVVFMCQLSNCNVVHPLACVWWCSRTCYVE